MAPKASSPISSAQTSKQRTISSFFTPKSTSNSAPKPAPVPAARPLPSPKRSLENSDEENEEPDLPVKRLRVSNKASNPPVEPEPQASSADRTSRYIYTTSQTEQPLPPRTKEQELLHQRFVKKLSRPDVVIGWSTNNLEEGAEGEEDDEDEEPAPKSSKATGVPKKLTPMEKQYLDIKRKHLDKVIVYQVGYKYRFFGEDARIAQKELGLVCIPGKYRFDEHLSEAHIDRFASASFPLARLHVHVKRLVAAGHKVGVVRQLETAALKAAGSNRNAPFVRELTNVYTKGTYIDEVDTGDDQASTSGYLLCLTETNVRSGDDEKVRVGMIATQPAIDSVIIYDDFEDGFMRTEIETRLLHLSPCEYLILGDLSPATHKLINHLSLSNGIKARVEYVEKPSLSEASSKVSSFFAGKMLVSEKRKDEEEAAILERILKSPDNVTLCLNGMIDHLRDFSLESVFKLTDFHSFSTRTHMLLNGNTLSSLEIYENQTDFTPKGSLFWSLDRTKTRFGKRLLRRWVGRPLLDKAKLEERIQAVEELKDNEASAQSIKSILNLAKGDLEKTLIRIYYKRANRPEILKFLQAMQQIGMGLTGSAPRFASKVINDAITDLPVISDPISGYLERISLQAAKSDDKYEFFTAEHESEEISEQKLGIVSVEFELEDHKADIAKILGKKQVEYVTVSGTDFLVEVENTKAAISKVPANWVKISNTKKCSRFRTPTVIKLLQTRDQHKESLEAACDDAFIKFQEEIVGKHYQMLRDAIQSLAVLDCLESLAVVATQPGYVKPEFSNHSEIVIKQGRHPMVEQILLDTYVPNDIALQGRVATGLKESPHTDEVPSSLLVTGPNMGGKSSYVRSIALICIMAQLGSYVPCDSARIGLLDAVFTRMGASDRLGASTFAVELSETSGILAQATTKSLVILDELGRGTSTHDGAAIAEAVLRELVVRGVMTMFITHYMDLARVAEEEAMQTRLKNVHMRFEEIAGDESAVANSQITFLYEAASGVAHRSYGLNVARLANVSEDVLAVAREKSREMEEGIRRRKVTNVFRLLGSFSQDLDSLDGGNVERVVAGIEHL